MNRRTMVLQLHRAVRVAACTLILLLLIASPAFALTYVVGFETGSAWDPVWGQQYPPTAYGAKADIGTPSLPITLHPATIKIVVGGRYATVAGQKQHRAGWIMRTGETKPRNYIEGYDPYGNWYNIFPILVSGGTSYIDWGVQTPARVEYYANGIYKALLANTWWASSYTSYPSYLPIPHYVVGLASGTGNDLNGIVRNAMRKADVQWWEFRDWNIDVTTDPSKYYFYMVSTGFYRDDFNIHSVY